MAFEAFCSIWRSLNALSNGSPELYFLTLTHADPDKLPSALAALGALMAGSRDSGLFLVTESSDSGREHVHGLVLTADLSSLREQWLTLGGGIEKAQPVTGWRGGSDRERMFARNLAGTTWYPFKRWRASERSLDRDVSAYGVFENGWLAARATLAERPSTLSDARRCTHCGLLLRPEKRSNALTCSAACRTAACRAKKANAPPLDSEEPF